MNPLYTLNILEVPTGRAARNHEKNIIKYAKEIRRATDEDMQLHKLVATLPRSSLFFSPISYHEPIVSAPDHILTYREELIHPLTFFKSKAVIDRTLCIVSSFRHLVQALGVLHDAKIRCIDYQQIGYHKSETPRIYGFRHTPHSDQSRYWPIECHMLARMKQLGVAALSRDNIRHFTRLFFQSHTGDGSSRVKNDDTQDPIDKIVSEFLFLVNKPLHFLEEVVEKNSEKAFVYGIGVFFADLVSHDGFDMVPDELVTLINKCRDVSLKHRPFLCDVICELDQFS